ncbi:MAG: ABC transporter permease [Methylobacter sp.]|uniref:ABC transporter permease n=1 Tax=Methylovulum miyakonense TaxID=645578 RepID=UPI00035C1985|nr:ABC transporter permease [Methylovulum miyakonense]PPD39425.1 MAG: ABC transporter permease [Methylobacter sp.]
MQRFSISPKAMVGGFWRNRGLIKALVVREVTGRYKGTFLGMLWSFFTPFFMLLVYTFFLSVVLKARWPGGSSSKAEFALVLFVGLMTFNLFAECINRAPSLVLGNINYVKKVVFPLEILPMVALGSATFHMLVSFTVWLLFHLVLFGIPPATIVLFPLALLPLVLLTLGFSWFLVSLGVYMRDITQVIGVMTSALMFLSPIFYPIESLPASYRPLMQFSPLTLVVEWARDVMIWGKGMDWLAWSVYMLVSLLVAWLGFAWFQKTRKGFADVL